MNKAKSKEIIIAYMLSGLFSGFILHLLFFTILFQILERDFTFFAYSRIFLEYPLVFITASFPFLGLIIAYFHGQRRIDILQKIEELNDNVDHSNSFIKSAIKDFTIGNLNTKHSDEKVEKEIVQSLVTLQARLIETRDTEKATRKGEQQRNWTSEGLATFGDMLRTHSSDRDKLGYQVISNLVRYLDINQGGFFVKVEDGDEVLLKMIACHAYDRNKFPDQIVKWGEGLIGAVAIERKSYYTDKIPGDYLKITSGLGRANPKYLLIVPQVLNDEVYGVFELASFKKFEDFEIQFIERVAENTATTLRIMESNFRTEQLLKETQEQASKLAQQEEKVRQNMEELTITQMEAARQSEQFISFTNTVNHTLIRAEYDMEGKLIYANTRFLRKLGYSGNREVEGKSISTFIHSDDLEWFNEIWERLASGGLHYEGYMRHITKLGLDLWTMATYTCVRKDDGTVEKVLFLAIDNTEQKEESLDYEGQIKAINKLSPKAEFSPEGRVINFNELFERTLKYQSKEIRNKNIFDFIAHADQERFNEIWEQVISGTAFQGQIRMLGKFEEEIWLRTTFTSVADMYGEVDKIVFLAFEITKEKNLELLMRNQNEILKEKEEELRLQSLDLKKQIDDLKISWEKERSILLGESQKYKDIIDSSPNVVIAINNQGFVTFFNIAAEKYWKIKRSKVLMNRSNLLLKENQNNSVIAPLIDPGKAVIEIAFKETDIILADGREKKELISIIKTESGSELIYTLIIHQNH
jgi:PAS domain S-box-containing protein